MKVKECLANKENWTTKAFARNKDNKEVFSSDEKACKFCLYGAMNLCYKEDEELHDVGMKVNRYIMSNTNFTCIIDFNDSPKTTHEDILKLVNELDI